MSTSIRETTHVPRPVTPELLEELRPRLGGPLLEPGEPAYDQVRSLWNGMIDARPALIAQPAGVADIIQLIAFAREQGLEIAVKGGGHNVAGYASTDGGMMLDLERLRHVRVDPERRTAVAGGGARWADLDRETGAFRLATTGGVISSTGVAGLTLGGGIGWLVGKHGLPATTSAPSISSPPTASWSPPAKPRTRISSGRSGAGAATSAWRPRSSSASTTSRWSTPAWSRTRPTGRARCSRSTAR